MAGRVIAGLIMAGTQVFVKAFGEAYRQGVKNATKVKNMDINHARQILDVPVNATPAEINARYTHLFNVNDPSKGGSFYIQSKVVAAKEFFDAQMKEKAGGSGAAGSSSARGTSDTKTEA